MNEEFEIKGQKFKLYKIDVFKQFHIARRLGPIMGDIFQVLPKIQSKLKDEKSIEKLSQEEQLEAISQLAKPVMTGFSKLSDEDSDFVLLGLCSSVQIQQSNNWAWVARDGALCFNTLDLSTLLQIAGRAFMFNLSGFISTAPQISHGGK